MESSKSQMIHEYQIEATDQAIMNEDQALLLKQAFESWQKLQAMKYKLEDLQIKRDSLNTRYSGYITALKDHIHD